MVLGKGVLKIYSKFTGEQPRQSVISIKLATLLKSQFGISYTIKNSLSFAEEVTPSDSQHYMSNFDIKSFFC